MLRTLRDFFDGFAAREPTAAERTNTVQLATAVLLMEVMRADNHSDAAERVAVQAALRRTFALTDDALAELLAQADESMKLAHDYHYFSSSINAHFTQDEKIRIIEAMWQVAFVDARLDAHENHVISKVAGLLHVTHGEYIGAKMRAKENTNLL